MSIFEVNNAKYAVGLTWHSADKDSVNAEIQQKIKSLAGNKKSAGLWGVILAESETEQQYATTENKDHEKAISAACVLADYQSNGELWFVDCLSNKQDDDDAVFWFCSIEQGVITSDKIGTREEIKDEIVQLSQYFADEDQVRELTTSVELEDEFAFDMGLSVAQNTSFHDILSEISKPEKAFADYKLKSLKKTSPIALAFAGTVILAGVFFGYSFMNTGVVIDDAQFEHPDVISTPDLGIVSNRANEIEEIKSEAYQEEIRWLRNKFKSHDSQKVLSKMVIADQSLPDYVGGWRITNVGYTINNSQVISISLTREAFGTPVTLEKSFVNYESMSFEKGGQNAMVTLNIGDIRRDKTIDEFIKFIEVGAKMYGVKSIMHDAHFAGLGWRVEAEQETPRPEEIIGLTDKKEARTRQLTMIKDALTLSDEGIDTLMRSGLILNKAETLLIKTINISREEAQTWRLEGTIYDHKEQK